MTRLTAGDNSLWCSFELSQSPYAHLLPSRASSNIRLFLARLDQRPVDTPKSRAVALRLSPPALRPEPLSYRRTIVRVQLLCPSLSHVPFRLGPNLGPAKVVYVDSERPCVSGIRLGQPKNIWELSFPPDDWHEDPDWTYLAAASVFR